MESKMSLTFCLLAWLVQLCADVANLTASDDSHIILRPGFLCLHLIFTRLEYLQKEMGIKAPWE